MFDVLRYLFGSVTLSAILLFVFAIYLDALTEDKDNRPLPVVTNVLVLLLAFGFEMFFVYCTLKYLK